MSKKATVFEIQSDLGVFEIKKKLRMISSVILNGEKRSEESQSSHITQRFFAALRMTNKFT